MCVRRDISGEARMWQTNSRSLRPALEELCQGRLCPDRTSAQPSSHLLLLLSILQGRLPPSECKHQALLDLAQSQPAWLEAARIIYTAVHHILGMVKVEYSRVPSDAPDSRAWLVPHPNWASHAQKLRAACNKVERCWRW